MLHELPMEVSRTEAIQLMNEWGESKTPFFFCLSYDGTRNVLARTTDHAPGFLMEMETPIGIWKSWGLGRCPVLVEKRIPEASFFHPSFISYDAYFQSFQTAQKHLIRGNSYLLNLTVETELETNFSAEQIFTIAQAPFKILYRPEDNDREEESIVCFSPEPFIHTSGNVITTNPMKGTIDANQPHALDLLMEDEKEKREHATIVDLLRNDLSQVATSVRVVRYRYSERIETDRGQLIQTSSEISGILPDDWRKTLGTWFHRLLPAGSVTGAPKEWTCKGISEAENFSRGFYTGVFGFFDGESLSSAVSIRFLEQKKGKWTYKSGGGITTLSNPENEYRELCEKIYIPSHEPTSS